MILAATARSSADDAALDADAGYFDTEAHYLSLAGLIVAALRGGATLVLLTGDPLASPSPLSQALRRIADSRYTVIGISCGPDLTAGELHRAGHVVTTLPAGVPVAATAESVDPASPLFVFDEVDRLSDRQLEGIRAAIQQDAGRNMAGVLLASEAFLTRLDEPPLRTLKEAVGARLRFNEVGEDEGIDFLRHRLETRRNRDEAHGGRASYRWLTILGVLSGIAIMGWLALHYANIAGERSQRSSIEISPPAALPQPQAPSTRATDPATAPTPTASQPSRTPEPTSGGSEPPALDATAPQVKESAIPPSLSPRSAGPHLPPAEIAALVARGDAYLSAGDIASARLFYERAADAGDGAAALRLGATFDPAFLGRAGVRGALGDPDRAASWYRRAYELGEAAAADRLKNLGPLSAH